MFLALAAFSRVVFFKVDRFPISIQVNCKFFLTNSFLEYSAKLNTLQNVPVILFLEYSAKLCTFQNISVILYFESILLSCAHYKMFLYSSILRWCTSGYSIPGIYIS